MAEHNGDVSSTQVSLQARMVSQTRLTVKRNLCNVENGVRTLTKLHGHIDERWPTEVTSNTYFHGVWWNELRSNSWCCRVVLVDWERETNWRFFAFSPRFAPTPHPTPTAVKFQSSPTTRIDGHNSGGLRQKSSHAPCNDPVAVWRIQHIALLVLARRCSHTLHSDVDYRNCYLRTKGNHYQHTLHIGAKRIGAEWAVAKDFGTTTWTCVQS